MGRQRTQTTPTDAFPLAWPIGWVRTNPTDITGSRYKVSMARALGHLVDELRRFKATSIMITTNVQVRRDGLPYASAGEPKDRGVAAYWNLNGKPMVMACDQWRTVAENVRAIGLSVQALRQIERAGASHILERAFTGFAALPAGETWRDVMGYKPGERPPLEELKARHRALVLQNHPDRGGSDATQARVNVAMDNAKRELGYSAG